MSAEADIILSATSLQPVPTGLGPTWNLGFWLVFAFAWCELGASLGGALTGGPPGGGGCAREAAQIETALRFPWA